MIRWGEGRYSRGQLRVCNSRGVGLQLSSAGVSWFTVEGGVAGVWWSKVSPSSRALP